MASTIIAHARRFTISRCHAYQLPLSHILMASKSRQHSRPPRRSTLRRYRAMLTRHQGRRFRLPAGFGTVTARRCAAYEAEMLNAITRRGQYLAPLGHAAASRFRELERLNSRAPWPGPSPRPPARRSGRRAQIGPIAGRRQRV